MAYKILLLFLVSVLGFVLGGYFTSEGLKLLIESGVPILMIKVIYGTIFTIVGSSMMIYFIVKPLTVAMKYKIKTMLTKDVEI